MAGKQSSEAETKQESETNGAGPQRGTKTATIRELIARGVTNAKDIAAEMARQGISVSMPVIYTTLKESKKGRRRKGGRKPKEAVTVAAANGPSARPSATAAGMTADELLQLAEIAKKAGGVDAVVGLLNVIKHFQ